VLPNDSIQDRTSGFTARGMAVVACGSRRGSVLDILPHILAQEIPLPIDARLPDMVGTSCQPSSTAMPGRTLDQRSRLPPPRPARTATRWNVRCLARVPRPARASTPIRRRNAPVDLGTAPPCAPGARRTGLVHPAERAASCRPRGTRTMRGFLPISLERWVAGSVTVLGSVRLSARTTGCLLPSSRRYSSADRRSVKSSVTGNRIPMTAASSRSASSAAKRAWPGTSWPSDCISADSAGPGVRPRRRRCSVMVSAADNMVTSRTPGRLRQQVDQSRPVTRSGAPFSSSKSRPHSNPWAEIWTTSQPSASSEQPRGSAHGR
jgi:hypothetical protein